MRLWERMDDLRDHRTESVKVHDRSEGSTGPNQRTGESRTKDMQRWANVALRLHHQHRPSLITKISARKLSSEARHGDQDDQGKHFVPASDGASNGQEIASANAHVDKTIVYTSTQHLLRSRDGTTQRWTHEVQSSSNDNQDEVPVMEDTCLWSAASSAAGNHQTTARQVASYKDRLVVFEKPRSEAEVDQSAHMRSPPPSQQDDSEMGMFELSWGLLEDMRRKLHDAAAREASLRSEMLGLDKTNAALLARNSYLRLVAENLTAENTQLQRTIPVATRVTIDQV